MAELKKTIAEGEGKLKQQQVNSTQCLKQIKHAYPSTMHIAIVSIIPMNRWCWQNLYEAVRSDRNLYSKNLMQSQEEISEMKLKFKIMNRQIENLKEEITAKDQLLVKEHFDFKKARSLFMLYESVTSAFSAKDCGMIQRVDGCGSWVMAS